MCSGSEDGSIRVWRLDTLAEERVLNEGGEDEMSDEFGEDDAPVPSAGNASWGVAPESRGDAPVPPAGWACTSLAPDGGRLGSDGGSTGREAALLLRRRTQKLGNDVRRNSESIATKLCSQIGRKAQQGPGAAGRRRPALRDSDLARR